MKISDSAIEYVESRIAVGALTAEQIAWLVAHWQTTHGLVVDGKPGPITVASILSAIVAESRPGVDGDPDAMPLVRVWPLRTLLDGRAPQITSRYYTRNPERAAPDHRHRGVDLFYRYDAAKDGPVKDGDGGRTGAWFIPDGTHAVAAGAGVVAPAAYTGATSTGMRTWILHENGYATGYFHLRTLEVKPGQHLLPGDPIGIVSDNPADFDAKHLHFELYAGPLAGYPGGSRDPEDFLAGAAHLSAEP